MGQQLGTIRLSGPPQRAKARRQTHDAIVYKGQLCIRYCRWCKKVYSTISHLDTVDECETRTDEQTDRQTLQASKFLSSAEWIPVRYSLGPLFQTYGILTL